MVRNKNIWSGCVERFEFALQPTVLIVRMNDGVARNLESLSVYESGLILDIAEERERINIYLGIAPPQRELALVASVQG